MQNIQDCGDGIQGGITIKRNIILEMRSKWEERRWRHRRWKGGKVWHRKKEIQEKVGECGPQAKKFLAEFPKEGSNARLKTIAPSIFPRIKTKTQLHGESGTTPLGTGNQQNKTGRQGESRWLSVCLTPCVRTLEFENQRRELKQQNPTLFWNE